MDNLKIQGIFPSSMSDISIKNQSQFGGASLANHKNQIQKLTDYQIKINAPDTKCPNTQKYPYMNNQTNYEQCVMPQAATIQYRDKVNGYDLNKDAFSQEEILKAFNIIDINKDNVITQDDLIFVLDYLKEEYTLQEVREMISMLCADNKHVTFEEFKKLGRGDVVPLAKINLSDQKRKSKAHILNNLEKSNLINENPNFYIDCLKKQMIQYSKYQQSKKNIKAPISNQKVQYFTKDKLFTVVPLRSPEQFKQRQQSFSRIVMTQVRYLIENYQQVKQKLLNTQKISQMLQIKQSQARELYGIGQVDSLLVIMEAIVYSKLKMAKKLQYCIQIANNKSFLTMSQIVYVIQIIKGIDNSIQKKIKAILMSKNIKFQQDIPKNVVYEIVLEYLNKLIGFY